MGGTILGGVQTVKTLTCDASQYMTRPGYYRYEVRGLHKTNDNITGDWVSSEAFYVSDEEAASRKAQNDAAQNFGTWEKSGKKANPTWKYKLEDGTYATGWKDINYKTYYFTSKGVMVKGWKEIKKKWYYFDPTDGYLWKGTTTPDGYYVDFDGVWNQ